VPVGFSDVLPLIIEVLSWVGLAVGIPLFICAVIQRSVFSRWREVDVELVETIGADEPVLARWFTDERLHERALDPTEHALRGSDAAKGYADPSGRLRFERHSTPSRIIWTLSVIFLSLGAVAFVASIVLMLVMG
jgi:hypothetical protein